MKQLFLFFILASSFVNLNGQTLKQIKQKTPDKNFTEIFTIDKKSKLKHGKYQKFISKTILVEEGEYKQGKKEGVWKTYKKGKVFKIKIYSNGEITFKNENEYQIDDQFVQGIHSSGMVRNGKKTGSWDFFLFDKTWQTTYNYDTKEITYFNDSLFQNHFKYEFKINNEWTTGELFSPPFLPGGQKILVDLANNVANPNATLKFKELSKSELTYYIDEYGKISNGRITNSSNQKLDAILLEMYNNSISKFEWFPAFVNQQNANKAVGMEYVIEIRINRYNPGLIKTYKVFLINSHPKYIED